MRTEWIEIWTRKKPRNKVLLAHVASTQNAGPIINDFLVAHGDLVKRNVGNVIVSAKFIVKLTEA